MLTRLGGRKFLMALITIGVGTAIEMYTTRGITPAFAGLLATIVATFSITNTANSKAYFNRPKGEAGGSAAPP